MNGQTKIEQRVQTAPEQTQPIAEAQLLERRWHSERCLAIDVGETHAKLTLHCNECGRWFAEGCDSGFRHAPTGYRHPERLRHAYEDFLQSKLTAKLNAERKRQHQQKCQANAALIAKALRSLNRAAHRTRIPGLCKCRLAMKSAVLKTLRKLELAFPVARQLVNGRECVCLEFAGTSFHMPSSDLHGASELPLIPSMEKDTWDEPEMPWYAAQRVLKEFMLITATPQKVTCPKCKVEWRYDLGQSRIVRTCPKCFVPRYRWFEDEDDFDEDEDWEDEE